MFPSPTLMLQIAGLLLIVVSLAAAGHALLAKRDPRSALGWVALIIFSPVIGIFVYLLFGINRIRRRAVRLREERGPADDNSGLIPGAIGTLQRPFLSGNDVDCLLSGQATLQAVSRLVRNAQHSICLSVYIFESEGVGDWLIMELGNAVKRGVDVRVLLDGVGLFYSRGGTRRKLVSAGVKVGIFLGPTLFPPAWHINLRNHRKILVVDELEAIVGGTNVRNAYVVQPGQTHAEAKDVNFTLRGPVVEDIVTVFADDWLTATNEIYRRTTERGAQIAQSGGVGCRVTVDGPDNDIDLISLLYMAAISEAKERVRIVTPYFLPPQELVASLQVAAIRGFALRLCCQRKTICRSCTGQPRTCCRSFALWRQCLLPARSV